MGQSSEEARAQCQAALGELVQGRPEAFKGLWSHADGVTIMGRSADSNAAGRMSPEPGLGERRDRRQRPPGENLLTVVGDDLACTVYRERTERTRDGRTYHRVLHCTQVYRRENESWKVIVRHADELPERDPLQG